MKKVFIIIFTFFDSIFSHFSDIEVILSDVHDWPDLHFAMASNKSQFRLCKIKHSCCCWLWMNCVLNRWIIKAKLSEKIFMSMRRKIKWHWRYLQILFNIYSKYPVMRRVKIKFRIFFIPAFCLFCTNVKMFKILNKCVKSLQTWQSLTIKCWFLGHFFSNKFHLLFFSNLNKQHFPCLWVNVWYLG